MGVILIIGVSGSGKSTIGQYLAERLNGTFLDADDFHPVGNLQKMSAGTPLRDADRWPWLERLVQELQVRDQAQATTVLACSALKRAYREYFRQAMPSVQIVYLRGSYELIENRMRNRKGHFMKTAMLKSQFAALEEPTSGIVIDIDQPTVSIVEEILETLSRQDS